MLVAHAFEQGPKAIEKSLAGGFGMAFAQDDFIEDLHSLIGALEEEHGHGIDVEIERPDEGIDGIEVGGADVDGAIKRIVDAIAIRG